jgi:hypothetical protein
VKVIFVSRPHPWQSGEMINLLDIIERCLEQFRIQYRTPDILHFHSSASRWTKIKNAHATTLSDKGRNQMLPNKAAATCNECLPHRFPPKSLQSSTQQWQLCG